MSIRKKLIPLHPQFQMNARSICPDGGIGRRVGLKHQYLTMCRFEPGSGYNVLKRTLVSQALARVSSFLSLKFGHIWTQNAYDLRLGIKSQNAIYCGVSPSTIKRYKRDRLGFENIIREYERMVEQDRCCGNTIFK